MAVELIANIAQKNNGDFYLVDSKDIKGGLYSVDTEEEMYSIPRDRFKDGMLCWVKELGIYKRYDTTTDSWVDWENSVNAQDVEDIISSYITTHKEELKGEKGDPGVSGVAIGDTLPEDTTGIDVFILTSGTADPGWSGESEAITDSDIDNLIAAVFGYDTDSDTTTDSDIDIIVNYAFDIGSGVGGVGSIADNDIDTVTNASFGIGSGIEESGTIADRDIENAINIIFTNN